MNRWIGAVMTAAVFMVCAASAHADVRYVSPGGSGDCSQPNPCGFDTARLQAVDGDVLQLAAGEYALATDQVFGARVTIEGVRGARPVLNVRSLWLDAPGSVLRDVTVIGSGGHVLRGTGAVIERVDASNSASSVGTLMVCLFDGPGSVVTDTACHANATAKAIALNGWFGRPSADGDFLLRNVTAISATSALATFEWSGRTTGRVTNSILAGPLERYATGVTLDQSAYTHGNIADEGTFGTSFDGTFGTPFAGPRPIATSSTIDSGLASPSQWDLAGNPRTTGVATDLGALEWVPEPPSPPTTASMAWRPTAPVCSATSIRAAPRRPTGSSTALRPATAPRRQ